MKPATRALAPHMNQHTSFYGRLISIFLGFIIMMPVASGSSTNPALISSVFKSATTTLPTPPNSGPQPTILEKFAKVDAGSSFVCGILKKNRKIKCWGLNDLGQLNAPTKGKFKLISLGQMHGCAIKFNNRMVCWGDQGSIPKAEELKDEFLTVSAGDSHTCAIKRKGRTIHCWGTNLQRQLTPPVGKFKSISARNNQTCAVSDQGQVLCWGEPAFVNFNQPMGVYTDVTVGKLHACAVRKSDRGILCWGNNAFGTLNAPVGERFREVMSGDYHTCGETEDRQLRCWGRDQWGQVSGVPSVRIHSFGLGGAITCLTDEQSHINCLGSYEYNTPFLETVNSQGNVETSPEETVHKTGGWSTFAGFVAKGAGYGLKTWGESMETGSGGQKFVFFVAEILGSKPDKNKQRFEAIQVQMKEVQQQLTDIEKTLDSTYLAVQQLSCQAAMTQFIEYKQTVNNAHEGYQRIVNDVLLDLTNRQLGRNPDTKLPTLFKNFSNEWDNPVNSQLVNVLNNSHRYLVDAGVSPLVKCMNADLEAWRQTAEHPFDDRNIYVGTYNIQETAELMQIQALILLQEINAWRAVDALTDVDLGLPLIDTNLIPETGLCGEARRQAASFPQGEIPTEKQRWVDVIKHCNMANQLIINTYKRLVQQIEFAGAPYTSDAVVTSLSGKVFGHGDSTTNWLWINLDRVSPEEISFKHSEYIGGFPMNFSLGTGFTSIEFKNGGEANWYSSNRGGAGLWLGASQAWEELYASYDAYLKKNNKTDDLLGMMARLEGPSITNEKGEKGSAKLLPKIADEPIWMSNKFFDMEWDRLVGDSKIDKITSGVHCFLAAGINPAWYYSSGGSNNPKLTLRLTGKVCSSEELAGMARQAGSMSGDVYGNGEYTLWNYSENDKYYRKYANFLGGWTFLKGVDGWKLLGDGKFFNDGDLRHYPVVDLNSRACEPSLVIAPADGDTLVIRHNTLTRGNGLEIPTRCGKDMDKFIEDRVPRPTNPVIPDAEVRQPVY